MSLHSCRGSAGDYTCRASNIHGTEETTMTLSVLFPPSCIVTHSVEGADLLLKCSVDANPEVRILFREPLKYTIK